MAPSITGTARRKAAARPFTGAKPLAALLAALLPAPASASATGNPAALCEEAARIASDRAGVPLDILRAVALTETGHRPAGGGPLQPWPWATNQGGAGNWFPSHDEAAAHVDTLLAEGVTNVDLGCFQLNHRWHADAFASTADMLDPLQNALYAASLLKRHYAASGDWSAAAGAYHSGTPGYAERYRARFDAILADLGTAPATGAPLVIAAAQPDPQPRENTFPLLRAAAPAKGPSLFPAVAAGRRLIGD